MIIKTHSVHNGMSDAAIKYQPYPQIGLKDRTWPGNVISTPPIWW